MNVSKISLITDSTNDLPPDLRQRYGIRTVPLYIAWGSQQYVDGVEMTSDAFYQRLQRDEVLPGTSQPTPQDFARAYQRALDEGAEEIIVMTISSGLSGTIQSAKKASEMVKAPIHVYDSKDTTMGLGWQVLAAVRVLEAGGTAAEAIAAADAARRKMVLIVSLDTLEYLHKGGRIGRAAYFIGSMLDLKPQVLLNHETGTVEAGERTRSRAKAVDSLFQGFLKRIDVTRPLRVAVQHTGAYVEAQALFERFRTLYHPVEMVSTLATPVLGVHVGPRALGIVGYTE
ncbi:MAG TPA: DegV family protein [Anaerolineaceae bacterium]|nr:DegV family protein [Anaerolineaceae bacterium]